MVVTGRTVTVARGKVLAAKFFHPGEPHHIAAAPCLYRYAGLPCCSARNNADNAPATHQKQTHQLSRINNAHQAHGFALENMDLTCRHHVSFNEAGNPSSN